MKPYARMRSPSVWFGLAAGVVAGNLFAGLSAAGGVSRDFGLDISHYDGQNGISQSTWNQIYAEGTGFVFIKATEGLTGADDPAMTNNCNRATKAGLLVGVYHLPHAENRPTTAGAVQEADHFLDYANTNVGPGRLRPVLDLEQNNVTLSKTNLTDWIIAFCNEIIAQRGAGAAPIIYMGRSSATSEVDARLANYDFWLAYPTNVDASTSAPPPTASYPDPTGVFNNWSFWQYSWTGVSGGLSNLDFNVCHSEYKTLASYLIPTPSPVVIRSPSLGGGGFHFSFTNIAGTHFTVLRTTNLSLPLSNWTTLGAATEGPAGTFQFTDTNLATSLRALYRVHSP